MLKNLLLLLPLALISEETMCTQVITYATDIKTHECKSFTTPCDVPQDWNKTLNNEPCVTQLEVKGGWSLLGAKEKMMIDTFDKSCATSIWTYENDNWNLFDREKRGMEIIEDGKGYWTNLTSDCFFNLQKNVTIDKNTSYVSNLLSIELDNVSDSRCPSEGVTCITAGEVAVTLKIDSNESVILKPNEKLNKSGYILELVDVKPYPTVNGINLEDYKIELNLLMK